MSDATPAPPTTCAMCGAAASATLQLEACGGDCRSVVYCRDRDCQALHRDEHEEQCWETKNDRIEAVLEEAEHESFYHAAGAGDMAAVRALVEAGADVEEGNGDGTWTVAFGVVMGSGSLDVLVFLVEEGGADLCHLTGGGASILYCAAQFGHLATVRYAAKTAPEMIDVEAWSGHTPFTTAAFDGHIDIVRHLARVGCSIPPLTSGILQLSLFCATDNGHHDTVRLLTDIDSAGGWRPYAAARRMAYVRIRHKVSSSYTVLPEDHEDRELLHFVFGKNRVMASGEQEARRTRAQVRRSSMLAMPDVVFALVCRFLEGWLPEAEVRWATADEAGYDDEEQGFNEGYDWNYHDEGG